MTQLFVRFFFPFIHLKMCLWMAESPFVGVRLTVSQTFLPLTNWWTWATPKEEEIRKEKKLGPSSSIFLWDSVTRWRETLCVSISAKSRIIWWPILSEKKISLWKDSVGFRKFCGRGKNPRESFGVFFLVGRKF